MRDAILNRCSAKIGVNEAHTHAPTPFLNPWPLKRCLSVIICQVMIDKKLFIVLCLYSSYMALYITWKCNLIPWEVVYKMVSFIEKEVLKAFSVIHLLKIEWFKPLVNLKLERGIPWVFQSITLCAYKYLRKLALWGWRVLLFYTFSFSYACSWKNNKFDWYIMLSSTKINDNIIIIVTGFW